MNRTTRTIVAFIAVMLMASATVVPAYAHASLVTCGQAGPLNANGTQACGFPQFIQMLSGIIDFLLLTVAPIIMVGVILYAGILMLTSVGNVEAKNKAVGMITKAVIGMLIAMAAWIGVKFILVTLGVDTSVFPAFWT